MYLTRIYIVLVLLTFLGKDSFSIPEWAEEKDHETNEYYTSICYGEAKTEAQAKSIAYMNCNEKICKLFGVIVESSTKVIETTKDVSIDHKISEKCMDVRIFDRKIVKSGTECEDEVCYAWILQNYSKAAFLKEKKRLENPEIKSITIIKKGDKTFKDPQKCLEDLTKYPTFDFETEIGVTKRVEVLNKAETDCKGINTEDASLMGALNSFMLIPDSFKGRYFQSEIFMGIQQQTDFIKKINLLKNMEQEHLKGFSSEESLIQAIKDYLISVRGINIFVMYDELSNCTKIKNISNLWPKNYIKSLKACYKTDESNSNCETWMKMMVDANYEQCMNNRESYLSKFNEIKTTYVQNYESYYKNVEETYKNVRKINGLGQDKTHEMAIKRLLFKKN